MKVLVIIGELQKVTDKFDSAVAHVSLTYCRNLVTHKIQPLYVWN